jgi:hypothetical protein
MSEAINTNIKVTDITAYLNGFDPIDFVIRTEEGSLYLPVGPRIAWFRKVYPEGKIVTTIVEMTDSSVVVEAKVYKDYTDSAEQYLANDYATRYHTDKFGERCIEIASTAAIGRALKNAGFGTQYRLDRTDEPEIVDSPVQATGITISSAGESEIVHSADALAEPSAGPVTVKQAKALTVTFGKHAGKTLGWIAQNDPSDITWYAEKYRGSNTAVREAAKILLSAAREAAAKAAS